MDQLIPIINELQDTYSKLNMPFIDLPQIVIIGSQSAGKSSVLENIVKREFLPRGTGIVTRCPLILHLVHDPNPSHKARGRFLHKGDVDYTDFGDIKEEIIRQTDVLAGPNKNITDQPIILKIYSHEFPNLTLIDLPGLTKVAVESQPKDIDSQIKNTCLRFAKNENSIILAISAANVDLANSDSLRFAQELDPEGKRTLCVITKLDLMDKGTNAYDMLTGKVLPKQLGYIGVVSRSQEDIIKKKPIEESLCYEKTFFEKNYNDISKNNGTQFLTTSLNKLLKIHIKQCLPTLKQTIKDKIHSSYLKLEVLGPEIKDKGTIIANFLSSFTKAYTDINDGNFSENLKFIQGGALIAESLYVIYPRILMEINIADNLTDEMIYCAIKNTCGPDKMSFSRQKAFICLIRQQIEKLAVPSLKCLDVVFKIMREFVDTASKTFVYNSFPNLAEKVVQETHVLIKQSYGNTKCLVENLITCEKVDVMCSHPNFKLGYVLENMNFDKIKIVKNDFVDSMDELSLNSKNSMVDNSFRIICEKIDRNVPEFRRMLIYYINSVEEILSVILLFQKKDCSLDEKWQLFSDLFDTRFQGIPVILENKFVIIDAMLNEDYKVYDSLLEFELDNHLNKLVELKSPTCKEHECDILKNLVIEYFNMVRQNICYYVPKLIKAFLVVYVRETLMNHLQKIYSESNIDLLVFENEDIQIERMKTKELLEDLENVKRRIENI